MLAMNGYAASQAQPTASYLGVGAGGSGYGTDASLAGIGPAAVPGAAIARDQPAQQPQPQQDSQQARQQAILDWLNQSVTQLIGTPGPEIASALLSCRNEVEMDNLIFTQLQERAVQVRGGALSPTDSDALQQNLRQLKIQLYQFRTGKQ
jgi:hypothetical protein